MRENKTDNKMNIYITESTKENTEQGRGIKQPYLKNKRKNCGYSSAVRKFFLIR